MGRRNTITFHILRFRSSECEAVFCLLAYAAAAAAAAECKYFRHKYGARVDVGSSANRTEIYDSASLFMHRVLSVASKFRTFKMLSVVCVAREYFHCHPHASSYCLALYVDVSLTHLVPATHTHSENSIKSYKITSN